MFIPECESEEMLIDCFTLSLKSGFKSPEINYEIVKDYATKIDDDPIEVYRIMRVMLFELNG